MGAGMRKQLCVRVLGGSRSATDSHYKLLAVFNDFDIDGSGEISMEELERVMKQLAPSVSVRHMMAAADLDKNGTVNLEEMCEWLTGSTFSTEFFCCIERIWEDIREEEEVRSLMLSKHVQDRVEEIRPQLEELIKWSGGDLSKVKSEDFQKAFHENNRVHHAGLTVGRTCLDVALMERREVARRTQSGGVGKKFCRKMREDLTPIVRKWFAHYDNDGNGVLGVDESILFFSDFISKAEHHLAWMISITDKRIRGAAASDEIAKAFAHETIETLFRDLDDRMRRAFNLMDVSRDGKLQEDEVISTVIPGMPKHNDFLKALGLENLP